MKIHPPRLLSLAALSLAAFSNVANSYAEGPYKLVKEIPIGGDGWWDYLSVDADARHLFVSHGTEIAVVDLDKNEVIGKISDTQGVHGFAVAPSLGRGFSSNGKEDKVGIVDLKTLKTLEKVDAGANPDAILFEPEHQQVYAFNGHGQSATVIDGASGKVTATIPLDGKPEFAQVDPKAGRIYNNLEDKSQVAVIDTKSHEVVGRWPIAPGGAASGMAIDLAHHRLFLGCDNKMMVMMDSTNGKVVATVPIGEGVDANAFDPGTLLAFSSNGEGTVTIAHEDSPNKLTVIQTLATQKGARTMALDPKTHRIYLSVAEFDKSTLPAEGAPHQRPKMIPGSFKVLVYGLDDASSKK